MLFTEIPVLCLKSTQFWLYYVQYHWQSFTVRSKLWKHEISWTENWNFVFSEPVSVLTVVGKHFRNQILLRKNCPRSIGRFPWHFEKRGVFRQSEGRGHEKQKVSSSKPFEPIFWYTKVVCQKFLSQFSVSEHLHAVLWIKENKFKC